MKKLNYNFLFFILLMVFSLLVIFSSLFFKKLMFVGFNSFHNTTKFSTPLSSITPKNLYKMQSTTAKNQLSSTTLTSYKLSFATENSATSTKTKEIISSTPLFKSTTDDTQSLSGIYFMLPKTYYVEILNSCKLDSGADGYFVRYGSVEGYCTASALSEDFSTTTTTQSGISIKMYPDAGTYIRSTPEITNNKIRVIPQSTDGILYIGTITGTTPQDGTTNIWYFVEYNISDTKTVIGYIYSERAILSAPLQELIKEDNSKTPTTTPTTSPTATENQTQNPNSTTLNLSVSPALKWIIAILFIIPVIVIFVLLIKKPRKNADLIENYANKDTDFPTDEDLIPEFSDTETTRVKHPKKNVKFSQKIDPFVKFTTTMETSSELAPDTTNQNPNNFTQNYINSNNYSKTPNSSITTTKTSNNSNYFANSTTNLNNSTENYNNLNSLTQQSQTTSFNLNKKHFDNANFSSKQNSFSPKQNENNTKNYKKMQNFTEKTIKNDNFSVQNENFTDPTIFYKNSPQHLTLLSEDSQNPDCIKNQNTRNNSSLPPNLNLENSYSDYYENITNKKENLENKDPLSKPKFPKINIDDGYEFAEDFSISPTISFSLGKQSATSKTQNSPRHNHR